MDVQTQNNNAIVAYCWCWRKQREEKEPIQKDNGDSKGQFEHFLICMIIVYLWFLKYYMMKT